MKRILITIITATTLLVGCSSISEAETQSRFVTLSFEEDGRVIYDTQTGVEYWSSYGRYNSYNRGTLTMLVDANGKPLIYSPTP
jgi:hypothetical protein